MTSSYIQHKKALGNDNILLYGDAVTGLSYDYFNYRQFQFYLELDTIQEPQPVQPPCARSYQAYLPRPHLHATMYDAAVGSGLRSQGTSLGGGTTARMTLVSYKHSVSVCDNSSGTYMGITYPWRGLAGSL